VAVGRKEGRARGSRLEPLSKLPSLLPPLLRHQTKLSPWPRLLHETVLCITVCSAIARPDDTRIMTTTKTASHHPRTFTTPSKPLPCFCCTTHPPSIAAMQMQTGNMAGTAARQPPRLIFTQKMIYHFFGGTDVCKHATCAGTLPPGRFSKRPADVCVDFRAMHFCR
jgi:hypothetical protein